MFANLYGAIGVAAGLSYLGGGVLLDATSAPFTFGRRHCWSARDGGGGPAFRALADDWDCRRVH